jgi:hypothetical protein
MDPRLLGTATAFGLAASAGLNTTLPLLLVGLLARFGLLTLAPPFDALSGDVALAGLLLFATLEFVADKVPGADTVVHTLQWPLAAAAGAILFASQTSVIQSVSPQVAILVGLFTAGAMHGARATFRPAVTATTGGVLNPLVSLGEDVGAAILVGASLLSPLAALALLLVLVAAMVVVGTWFARRLSRGIRWLARRADLAGGAPNPSSA